MYLPPSVPLKGETHTSITVVFAPPHRNAYNEGTSN